MTARNFMEGSTRILLHDDNVVNQPGASNARCRGDHDTLFIVYADCSTLFSEADQWRGVLELVQRSVYSWRTVHYDVFQKFTNGIL